MAQVIKFLDYYKKEDKDVYFGRKDKIEELYKKVKRNPITIFYGLSGTGKTSLILCGLSNRFDERDWLSFVIRRGNNSNILTAINSSIQSVVAEEDNVYTQLNKIYYKYFRPIYLIFDQLEELFIYGCKAEKQEFIQFLVKIKMDFHFIKVILVLREEYFVHLDDFESAIPEIFQSRVRLEPVNDQEAAEIIGDMCRAVKLKEDSKVIAQIISHITVKPKGFQPESNFELIEKKIELPYLQVYFQEIIERNKEKFKEATNENPVELSVEDLPRLGLINDVLTDYIDKCVKTIYKNINNGTINADEHDIWKIMSALVSYKGTKQKKYVYEIQKIVSNEHGSNSGNSQRTAGAENYSGN